MEPFVSIIIPAYNEQKHIVRAINSTMAQTMHNIEIIIVDDGSCDATANKVSHLLANDNRIKLISHPNNQGLSQSRLDGINASNGEFVFFLDADDTISNNTIEFLYDKAKETMAEIILGGAQRITRRLHIKAPYFTPNKVLESKIQNARDLLPAMLSKHGVAVNAWGRLIKRDLLIKHFTQAESSFMGEDMILNVQIFNSDARVTYINDIIYNWTMGGKSSLSPQQLWQQNKQIHARCAEILSHTGSMSPHLNQAIKIGLETDLITSVAQLLSTPLISCSNISRWVKEQLNNSPQIDKDADFIIQSAHKHLHTHRFFYWTMPILKRL